MAEAWLGILTNSSEVERVGSTLRRPIDVMARRHASQGAYTAMHYAGSGINYNCYCFLPLYVFCGDQLWVAYFKAEQHRPGEARGGDLELLVKRLRQAWPRTRIVFRADSGFSRDMLLSWCDRNDVKYVVGIARNERLLATTEELMVRVEQEFIRTGKKQRLFKGYDHAALTWKTLRWVIAKAEHTDKGSNPRFAMTNIVGDPQKMYD